MHRIYAVHREVHENATKTAYLQQERSDKKRKITSGSLSTLQYLIPFRNLLKKCIQNHVNNQMFETNARQGKKNSLFTSLTAVHVVS